jgi:hypothetical protein
MITSWATCVIQRSRANASALAIRAFIDEKGTIEISYAEVDSLADRGYATASVEALVTKARQAPHVRRIVAQTPFRAKQRFPAALSAGERGSSAARRSASPARAAAHDEIHAAVAGQH